MNEKTKAFLEWARIAGVKAISMTGGDITHVEFFEVSQEEAMGRYMAHVDSQEALFEQMDGEAKQATEEARLNQIRYWSSD